MTNTDTMTTDKKQELRDITAHSSITGATSVDGLKTAMNNLIDEIKAQ